MIGVYSACMVILIVLKMLHRTHACQCFQFCCSIIPFMELQTFTDKGNWLDSAILLFLGKDCSKSNSEVSVSNKKSVLKSGTTNIGESIKHCFRVSNACWHATLHSKGTTFLDREYIGEVNLAEHGIKINSDSMPQFSETSKGFFNCRALGSCQWLPLCGSLLQFLASDTSWLRYFLSFNFKLALLSLCSTFLRFSRCLANFLPITKIRIINVDQTWLPRQSLQQSFH